jgi:xylulokinase
MAAVPVVGGAGDNAAGAVGVGVVSDGDALLSLGTSGVIFIATDTFRPNPGQAVHAFCHCLPGLWHQMAVHLSAAACIDWVGRLTGASDAAGVFARAQAVGPGAANEIFLPYLSGERTPHNDALVRGAFLQLDHDTDAGRLCEAVLEGVSFALADGVDALRDAGTRIERLAVIGGGARSRYWGRLLSAAIEVPLVYLRGGEVGPALGAARLAQLAVEGGTPRDVCLAPPIERVIEPDFADIELLAPKKNAFRSAYARITPLRRKEP